MPDDKDVMKALGKLVKAFSTGNAKTISQDLRTFLLLILTDPTYVPISHVIYDPGPPTSGGLPIKQVYNMNSVGYVEATGGIDNVVRVGAAVGRVFRAGDTIPDRPNMADPRFVSANIDPMSTYYHFSSDHGNMLPGAVSDESDDNVLMTWAQPLGYSDPDPNNGWTPAHAARQFIGIDGPGGGSSPPPPTGYPPPGGLTPPPPPTPPPPTPPPNP